MEKREEALAPTPEIGTAAANLDLEEERTEGKAVVAMPQLIKVLEAIEKRWERLRRRREIEGVGMEEEEGGEGGLKAAAIERLGNLKLGFHWLTVGWFFALIGPRRTLSIHLFGDVAYPVGLGIWIVGLRGGDCFIRK